MMEREAVWVRRGPGEGQRKKEPVSNNRQVFHRTDEHCVGESGAGAGAQSRPSGPTKSVEQRPWDPLAGVVTKARFFVLSPRRGRSEKGGWIGSEIELKNLD